MKKVSLLLLIWSALFMQIAMAEPGVGEDIEVKVKIAGESVTVDLSLVVPATRQEVWSVLTDFGHMADFISNLKESRVISTSGNTLKIFQRGVATYGPINFPFESTREIHLTPFDKIKSRMISGNMRRMEGTTRLIDEGGQTRIIYHTDTIQEVWVPPLAGNIFVEYEIREQFKEMKNEIIMRKRVNTPSAPIKIPVH
jgi:carbon monoxide dehydrogenase subunit G